MSQHIKVDDHQFANHVVVDDINAMLESLDPPLPPDCCIYRVPDRIRKWNEAAYTPQVISIGPFHHGSIRLENMNRIKMRYLQRFLQQTQLSLNSIVSTIQEWEGNVRRCYAENIQLSSDHFVKLILLDAIFIIELFQNGCWRSQQTDNDDIIQLKPWLYHDIRGDLILLENQLPFFIIEIIFNLAFASRPDYPSFTTLTFKYFSDYNRQDLPRSFGMEINHFSDLLRTFFLPSSKMLLERISDTKSVKHLYNAIQLQEAGVKFKKSSVKCLLDWKFENGVLEIPTLVITRHTETHFRNVVAFEQCHCPYDGHVTDYLHILDFLIDSTQDMDLLIRKGILVSWLGESNEVTTLFKRIKGNVFPNTNSTFFHLRKILNAFYEEPRHRWKANLKRDYLSTPWRIASTTAAVTLLIFTFIQTVCSIISVSMTMR